MSSCHSMPSSPPLHNQTGRSIPDKSTRAAKNESAEYIRAPSISSARKRQNSSHRPAPPGVGSSLLTIQPVGYGYTYVALALLFKVYDMLKKPIIQAPISSVSGFLQG
eukprot:1160798-Pelagomonas_calceolata.AAC.6